MKIEETYLMEPYTMLRYWIEERHRIHVRRFENKQRPPWTDDEILANNYFCNPFRENDRVTKFIHSAVREQFDGHPNLWMMVAMARRFNRIETIRHLIDSDAWPREFFDPEALRAALAGVSPVFGNAFMVCMSVDQMALALNYVWHHRDQFHKMIQLNSIERCTAWFQLFWKWGSFISYEVATDLRHTDYLSTAIDIYTFAARGPGSQRGLARIDGATLKTKYKQAEFCNRLMDLMDNLNADLADDIPRLEMRDVEHSLCEFDKYARVLYNQGPSKRLYNPNDRWRQQCLAEGREVQ